MKWTSSLLLSLLAAGATSATPIGDFNGLQTILTGIVEHAGDLSGLLEGATKDILDFVDSSRDAVEEDAKKVLSDAEKTVEKWAEGGREFVKQHGTTCRWHLS